MTENRNINMDDGNYNENIEGNYIQDNYTENVDQSRKFQVGDVGGDFNPTASPIMSDNAQISETVAGVTNKQKPPQKKLNIGIIIAVIAIVVTACISGLFNDEVREWLRQNTPLPIQEAPENQ